MKPYGNFIKDYKINSYLESLEDKFTAEFNGLPEIKRIDELKTKSIIKMTRKAFMAHGHG